VPNPEEWDAVKAESTSGLLSQLVTQQLLEGATPAKAMSILTGPGSDSDQGKQTIFKAAVSDLTKGSDEFTQAELRRYLKASRIFAREAGIKPGESAVIINGRVVGPFQPKDFRASDFATLEDFEVRKRTGPVVGALRGVAPFMVEDK
jgi:UDP-glucose:glycoprotein glucosyltransferase